MDKNLSNQTSLEVIDHLAVRQERRLDSIPEVYKTKYERLAVELALALDDADIIFKRYGYSPDEALALAQSLAFSTILERVMREVKESGMSFRAKARMQAEELLGHSFEIATDPNQSAAVRADLIKWTTKVGGLEPKESKDDAKTGGGLTLSITFAGAAPQQVISTHEQLTIEQEA